AVRRTSLPSPTVSAGATDLGRWASGGPRRPSASPPSRGVPPSLVYKSAYNTSADLRLPVATLLTTLTACLRMTACCANLPLGTGLQTARDLACPSGALELAK